MTSNITQHISIIDKSLRWLKVHRREHYEQRFLQLADERRKLKKILHAEREKPAIAAFGESQKGKSYLIGNLLQKKGAPFMVTDEAGQAVNFVREVNPKGDKREATGVVTRFTSGKRTGDGDRYSQQHPVVVKLFTIADIASILCDSYYNDLLDKQFYADDEIKAIADGIYDQYIGQQELPQEMLTEDDILDIKSYLGKYVKDAQGLLRSGYFEKLALVVRRIPQNDWPKVLQPLWHDNDTITQLFRRLLDALRSLSFKHEVYVDFDAVMHLGDNKNTIMSVDCLNGLDDKAWSLTTDVFLREGDAFSQVKDFPKCELCALCAETIFRIEKEFMTDVETYFYDDRHANDVGYLPETSRNKLGSLQVAKDLLADTDLLDFPGARNRLKLEERFLPQVDAKVGASNLVQMFLRGKVAYLFNSYSESRIINILLFCHDNEQPNVSEMYRMINNWVERYVGKDPQARQYTTRRCGNIPPLFVVGTKFNIDMTEKHRVNEDNDAALNDRWYGRFVKVLYTQSFNAESMEWFNNWDGAGNTFKNTFMLRDFKYSGCHGEGNNLYEGYVENSPSPSEKHLHLSPEFYKRLRDTFVSHPDVRKFFVDPALAWDLAATMNNDGALYIISKLATVARHMGETRQEQFSTELSEVLHRVVTILKEYYVSGDMGEQLAENVKKANSIFREMEFTCQNDPGYFGHLLQALQLTEAESYKEVHRLIPTLTSTVNDAKKIADYELIRKRCNQFAGCTSEDERWSCLVRAYSFFDRDEAVAFLTNRGIDFGKLVEGDTIKRKNSAIIAHDLIELWIGNITDMHLRNLFSGDDKLDESTLGYLVDILKTTSESLGLRQRIEDEISIYVDLLNTSDINQDLVADLVATTISDFVMDFGYRYLSEAQVQSFHREGKSFNIPCLDYDQQPRKEEYNEHEMTELFNDILDSASRFTPAYEANYNRWLEYMYAAFIAHVTIPEFDRAANDELKGMLDALK